MPFPQISTCLFPHFLRYLLKCHLIKIISNLPLLISNSPTSAPLHFIPVTYFVFLSSIYHHLSWCDTYAYMEIVCLSPWKVPFIEARDPVLLLNIAAAC